MKICILAGGEGSRWGEGDKTLLEVEGMPLLERTILQFVPYSSNIEVIGENRLCNTTSLACCKLRSFEVESYNMSNLILFGDTYYTDEAVKIIWETITGNSFHGIHFFGREGPSTFTGKEYGEIYAFHYSDYNWQFVESNIFTVSNYGNRKNFWELYRHMHCIPLDKHVITENFITIDDRTEDFDFREDYERWIEYSTV